ncbi:MAG: hypothetical protein EKK61_03235 [Rickettsiales bacterium]|nr:MAG: hypothetical protein EKK61_03235 [Rickettsiales bacterium]TXG81901.1 MAG: hypothetical protein E6R13_05770 [Spirochaetota bacterium]
MEQGKIVKCNYVKTSVNGNGQYEAVILLKGESVETVRGNSDDPINIKMRNLEGKNVEYSTKFKYGKLYFDKLNELRN